MKASEVIELDNWVLRTSRPGSLQPPPVLLMLHGWKGDENVMWVFADRAPENWLLIAPRAPLTAPESGYSWVDRQSESFSSIVEFAPSVRALQDLLASLPRRLEAQWDEVHLMGFSQGAALCYAWALVQPERVRTVAGLAGFLPDGIERYLERRPLEGKPFFVAHGSQDSIVPVDRMRQGVDQLERAGANVTFCEDRTGHRISSSCLRALSAFYRRNAVS